MQRMPQTTQGRHPPFVKLKPRSGWLPLPLLAQLTPVQVTAYLNRKRQRASETTILEYTNLHKLYMYRDRQNYCTRRSYRKYCTACFPKATKRAYLTHLYNMTRQEDLPKLKQAFRAEYLWIHQIYKFQNTKI